MLSDPVIKAFHAHDTCCLTSDRYLLAMVFVYFKKAKLEHEEYNRLNFFKALYLGTSELITCFHEICNYEYTIFLLF